MVSGLEIGDKNGRLTLLEVVPMVKGGNRKGIFLCDCGNTTSAVISHVKYGRTKSCGCLRKDVAAKKGTKHGMHGTGTYGTWTAMIARCENPNNMHFDYYGGRGISVCERWHDFISFYEDMGERPEGMTLDRINNDAGYSKENCRWATQAEQVINQRKRNGCASKYKGVTKTSHGSWCARIQVEGKRVVLGRFDTEEEAAHAFKMAEKKRNDNIKRNST